MMEFFRIESYRNQEKQRQRFLKKNKSITIPLIFDPVNSVLNSEFIIEKIYFNAFYHSNEANSDKKHFELFSALRLIKIYLLINLDAYKSKTDNSLELSVYL